MSDPSLTNWLSVLFGLFPFSRSVYSKCVYSCATRDGFLNRAGIRGVGTTAGGGGGVVLNNLHDQGFTGGRLAALFFILLPTSRLVGGWLVSGLRVGRSVGRSALFLILLRLRLFEVPFFST